MNSAEHPTTYFGRDLEAMSFARNYHSWILSEIAPYLGGDVMEVGAGTGSFSDLLLSAPALRTLLAIEPSENMFPILREHLKSDSRVQTRNETLDAIHNDYAERFDAVTYINVLEHIEDDAQQLRFAREILKPGGSLLIFVPALPKLYSDFDRQIGHFRRYVRKPLVDMVVAQGFAIDSQKYFDIAGILPWYLIFVLMNRPMNPGSVSLYDKAIVPIMRAIETRVAPPIGKNLLVVARKA